MSCEFCDIVEIELEDIIPNPTDFQKKYWKENYEDGVIDGGMEDYFDLVKENLTNEFNEIRNK